MNTQYKIGIAVTAKNRHESTDLCLSYLKKHSKGLNIILVDDGSDTPYKNADFRFEKSVGIARAKNKCLELLDDCDFIFLFDNDCWPIIDDWYMPYIKAYEETGCNHFSFTFSHLADGRSNGNKAGLDRGNMMSYHNACGCMIFLTKKCLEVVGGFSPEYGAYAYEHTDYSTRINNMGLTPYRFCDIYDSIKLFHSQDYYREVTTTLKGKQSRLKINAEIYKKNIKSKAYVPYKPLKTAIITTFFTSVSDPQRNTNWIADTSVLKDLINSMSGQKLIILHDCFNEQNTDNIEYVKVETEHNPYFQRWISIEEHVKDQDYDYVFCVDATDVVMQVNPFSNMVSNKLYVGDEQQIVSNKWLMNNHNHEMFRQFYSAKGSKTLLNAGLVGGSKQMMLDFLSKMKELYFKTKGEKQLCDMAMLNYICYEKTGKENIVHGSKVNTKFKKYEKQNPVTSWFKHK